MAYHFETVKLEKGMYGRSGRTFSQTLEELDPSEHYKGTALEGLDAFQLEGRGPHEQLRRGRQDV